MKKHFKEANSRSLDSFIYTGPSMNPLFQNSDFLKVEPYQDQKIKIGDVIVFRTPNDKKIVTHRVVEIRSEGIITRGDNCLHNDQWVLQPEQILGKVISARRGKRDFPVRNGKIGQAIFLFLQIGLFARKAASLVLRPVYRLLARISFIRIKPSVISFKRPAGEERQLRWGKFLIARKPSDKIRWRIRPPFKIFIDEGSLP